MLRDALFELGQIGYGFGVEVGVEGSGGAMNGAGFGGEVGFGPGAETSVEDVDVLSAHGAEHPPGSWSGKDAFLFIDDDCAGVRDAEG